MINTMGYLLAISVLGVLKLRARYDRIYSWGMFFISAFLLINFYNQTVESKLYGFSILWGETQLGKITLDFYPTVVTNQILLPVFLITVLTILNNNVFRSEEKRCAFNSCVILNFIALSLMFCATNYVQLITMVFVSDILGYIMLKNIDTSRRYVVYNFFADMCLFMILALACGKIQSIDMTRLLGYKEIGRHKDFVGLITALALSVKIGCFPFQGYLTDITATRFQRMNAVGMLVSPLSGTLLLLKLQNLLLVSNFFIPVFHVVMIASAAVGIIGVIVKSKIKATATYFNMAAKSLLMLILMHNQFNWTINLSLYLVFMYLFNQYFFELDAVVNRSVKDKYQFDIADRRRLQLKITAAEAIITMSLWGILLWRISYDIKSKDLFYISGGIIISFCLFLNQIYSKHLKNTYSAHKQQIFAVSFIACVGIMAGILYTMTTKLIDVVFLSTLILVITKFPWYKIVDKVREKQENIPQNKETKKQAFMLLMTYVGRMFSLFLDMFLSEKIITKGLNFITQQSTILFFRLNKKRKTINIICVLVGFLIFIIAFLKGGR